MHIVQKQHPTVACFDWSENSSVVKYAKGRPSAIFPNVNRDGGLSRSSMSVLTTLCAASLLTEA